MNESLGFFALTAAPSLLLAYRPPTPLGSPRLPLSDPLPGLPWQPLPANGHSLSPGVDLRDKECPFAGRVRRVRSGEPLWRVHQAEFGALAPESDPIDPRF